MRRFALFLLIPMLSGCTTTVNLEPAPLANHPACAEVSVRYPDVIADLPQRNTNAQATSAWGEPTAVITRCGLEAVDVSTLVCVTAGEVDWLVDDSSAPNYRFISFARNPAVEVIVDSEVISGVSALEALSSAISKIPATKTCTELSN
ncbi:MAG: hypothetical protein RL068_150 [Actinomycetota bacterium]|jgi:hypothetical protein